MITIVLYADARENEVAAELEMITYESIAIKKRSLITVPTLYSEWYSLLSHYASLACVCKSFGSEL